MPEVNRAGRGQEMPLSTWLRPRLLDAETCHRQDFAGDDADQGQGRHPR
jgi:hypothetical protein